MSNNDMKAEKEQETMTDFENSLRGFKSTLDILLRLIERNRMGMLMKRVGTNEKFMEHLKKQYDWIEVRLKVFESQ